MTKHEGRHVLNDNPYEPPLQPSSGAPHRPERRQPSQIVIVPAALSYFLAVIFIAPAGIGFLQLLDLLDMEGNIGLGRGILALLTPVSFAVVLLLNLFAGHRWLQRRYFIAALANGASFVWLVFARRVSEHLIDALL